MKALDNLLIAVVVALLFGIVIYGTGHLHYKSEPPAMVRNPLQ